MGSFYNVGTEVTEFITHIFGICKVKVKWSRYRSGVTQRVCRGTALLFHDCGTRRGWVVSSTPRPHFTPGKDPVPILQFLEHVPTQMPYSNFSFVPVSLMLQSRLAQQIIRYINISLCWTKLFIHPRHISTVKCHSLGAKSLSTWITVQQDVTEFSLSHTCRQLYMLTPIIRSSYKSKYSFWHWSTGSATIRSRCWVVLTQQERMVVDPFSQYQKQLNNDSGW